MKRILSAIILVLGVSSVASAATDLWIYTSIYREFMEMLKHDFEAKNPDIKIQYFQGGSEKIQVKIESELVGGKTQADIILTSDPFWSYGLISRGLSESPDLKFNYNSLMVIAVPKSMPASERPTTFKELAAPKYKNLVTMPSPLESGTAFAATAVLSEKLGWDYFKALRANDVLAAGGNSAVVSRLDSSEKKVGIVLLENVLAANAKGSKLDIIYPTDGSVAIPSAQLLFKASGKKVEAKKFLDFLMSEEGQKILVKGYMYPVLPKVASPEGARSLKDIKADLSISDTATLKKIAAGQKEIKKKFQSTVLD